MTKCFVTKLNVSSDNPELLRLGEMRMKIIKVQNPTENTQGFSLKFNKSATLEIVGDGYFTDKTLTENKGNRITLNNEINTIYVNGNNDVKIAILDKYSLIYMANIYKNTTNNVIVNVSDLKYSAALTSLTLTSNQVSGNIGDLKTLTALTNLTLSSNQVSGNIGDLKTLTALTSLALTSNQVSGNIGDLKTLTALTSLALTGNQVSGNIGDLKTLTALTSLTLSNPITPITGNISELSALSKCTEMFLKDCKLTGNLATLPASCQFVSFSNNKDSVFTWTTRPSTAKIIAIEGNAKITDIDKMLQDQAQCQTGINLSSPSWYKSISCVGTRTSASNAAVATLQSKGYTVSITPA